MRTPFQAALMAATFAVALAVPALYTGAALAKDYILTAAKPDKLVIVDPDAMAITKTIPLKDGGPMPMNIVPTADGKMAYVLINKWETIVGIDLDSGAEIMRLNLSDDTTRVKAMFGVDLSPDGTTLAVNESPVKLLTHEYQVQPTRISFYDAKTGKLLRRAEAPRQMTLVMYSKDGSKLYGLGRELYVFDAKTGKQIASHPTQNWGREGFYPTDILDVWSQWEQAGVMATPYYTARSDMDMADPTAYWTGLLTLDLDTGEMAMKNVENTDIFYFSTAVSPVDKNIVYGAYTQLSKFDLGEGKPLKRVELPHSYYAVNVSTDGSKVFVGGAMGDIAVFDAESLDMLGRISMPGEANMSVAAVRVINRDTPFE
ncbi:quinohemoprotein amine dehydrogenase subunit beta [Rhodospirillum sp. A1_3_36]|uniref:quinohemoprotein amine dehydrogenase subunit beta n=1 Tax=Rhodospirillum sp. A1_3_36 TaxID=3391666 RepID=UPI0039A4493B